MVLYSRRSARADGPTPSAQRLAAVTVPNPAPLQIVGRELHQYPVARQNADEVLPQLAGDMRQDGLLFVADRNLDAEHRVRQGLRDHPFNLNSGLFRIVFTPGSGSCGGRSWRGRSA